MSNEKKKVLIICRQFIPYAGSTGWIIRMLKLGEFLDKNNYEVYVLTGDGKIAISHYGYKDILSKLKCIYVQDRSAERECRMIAAQQKPNYLVDKSIYSITNKFGRLVLRFKRFIEKLSVPDMGIYYVNRYYKQARELIKEQGIKNVIVSGPPHSMQYAGLKLKKYFRNKINLIVDYRDSWTTRKIYSRKNKILQKINEYIEKKVLTYADYFTYVSSPILNKLKDKYGDFLSEKSHLVMNGYDLNDNDMLNKATTASLGTLVKIGHFGSLDDFAKDPSKFIDVFEKLLKKPGKIQKDIKIFFYGTIPHSLKLYIKEKLQNLVEFEKPVPHKDALRIMAEMDYLLIIVSELEGADEVLTGKLFDYICANKPIISVGPKNMEVSKLVKEKDVGLAMDITDEKDMMDKLVKIVSCEINRENFYRDFDIEKYSRQNQYLKFLEILEP